MKLRDRRQRATGQVALVTGASSGIGLATALLLNHVGMTVYGGARRVERMADLERRGVITGHLDVTKQHSNHNLVKRALDEQGRIDLLVNNAGYGEFGALEEVPPAKAKAQFDVCLFGLANLTQLVLPTMRQQGEGRIINISSIGGRIVTPMGGWYYAAKHALEAYSDVLRMEVKGFGIEVVVIEPGGVETEWGTIAAQNARQVTSANSPYAEFAAMVEAIGDDSISTAKPQDIAMLILRAATDARPHLRYLPGLDARVMAGAGRHLPPRLFQGLVGPAMNAMASRRK